MAIIYTCFAHFNYMDYLCMLQLISQLIEYCIVILYSMNIEISDSAEQCMFHVVNLILLCVKS